MIQKISFTCTAPAVELLFFSVVHSSRDSSCSFDLNVVQGVFVTGLVRRPLTPMSETSCHQHLTAVQSIDRGRLLSLRLSSQSVGFAFVSCAFCQQFTTALSTCCTNLSNKCLFSRHLANHLRHLAIPLLTERRRFDMLFHSVRSFNTLSLGSGKPNCVLGFSPIRVWLVNHFYIFIC